MKKLFAVVILISFLMALQDARATVYVYSGTSTGSGTDQWSTGTNWSSVPTSGAANQLTFTGSYANGATVNTNDNISGTFQLKQINLSGTGPGSGSATVTISGSAGDLLAFQGGASSIGPSGLINANRMNYIFNIAMNVGNSGTMNFSTVSSTSYTLAGSLSGSATITKTGGAQLTISNLSNTWAGDFQAQGGITIINGSLSSAQSVEISTANSATTLTVNGLVNTSATISLLSGSVAATLSGTGTVGAVVLNGGTNGGSNVVSSSGTLTTGAITVNGTGNTIGTGKVTGAITQNASSGLTVTGNAGSDALANLATLSGTGTMGAVSLAGNNTLSSSATLTTGLITVGGTNNVISSGSISGNAVQNAGSGLAVNGTLSGSDALGTNATLAGTGFVGATSLSGSNTLSSAGTLTVASLAVRGGGNQISSGTVNATGGTTVTGTTGNNGSLKVNGTLNGGAAAGAVGNGTASIGGSGTINGGITVSTGGVLAPGDATITNSGSFVTINNGGGAAFAIANSRTASGSNTVTAGTDYDQVNLTAAGANLTFSGSTTLTLNLASGAAATLATHAAGAGSPYIGVSDSTPGVVTNAGLDNYFVFHLSGGTTSGKLTTLTLVDSTGDTLTATIMYGTGAGSRFSDTNIGDVILGDGTTTFDGIANYSQEFALSYTGNYSTNSTTGGQDVVLTAIPEPGTWGMLFGGISMLIYLQRARRRKI